MWQQISGQFPKYAIPVLQEANAHDQATLHVAGMSLSEPHTYEFIGDFSGGRPVYHSIYTF